MASPADRFDDARADAFVGELGRACWRALPTLVADALAGAALTLLATALVPTIWLGPLVVGTLVVGPLAAFIVLRLARELTDADVPKAPGLWHVRRAVGVCAVPAVAVACLVANLELWAVHRQPAFLLSTACSAIIGLIGCLVGVVALPTAVLRADVRLTTIWRVSVFAVTRAPSAPLGTAVLAAGATWLAGQWTTLVLALVPVLVVAFTMLAAQTCLGRCGVSLEYSPRPGELPRPLSRFAGR